MLSTGEEIRSPQRSSRSGPILAKMPCTIRVSTHEEVIPVHANRRVGKSCKMLHAPSFTVCLHEIPDSGRCFFHGVHSFQISCTE